MTTAGPGGRRAGRPVAVPRRRSLRSILGMLVLGAAIVYTVSLTAVLVASQHDQRRPADAIIVLGAAQYNGRPSPVLRARLDHAIGLYREGYAPLIVVTGGVGRGDTISEAMAGRRYLIAREVPDDAVIAQPVGSSTLTSMNAVGDWLRGRGLHRVLLVSDPFHMFRLRLEARRIALEAYTSPTESSPISDNPVLELRYLFAEGLKVPIAWSRTLIEKRVR
ncbi:MAG: YdcF family protein [Gemmatimonadales bacterium]|nr:YdcF family protein [Gemmatimonadales bacterium]